MNLWADLSAMAPAGVDSISADAASASAKEKPWDTWSYSCSGSLGLEAEEEEEEEEVLSAAAAAAAIVSSAATWICSSSLVFSSLQRASPKAATKSSFSLASRRRRRTGWKRLTRLYRVETRRWTVADPPSGLTPCGRMVSRWDRSSSRGAGTRGTMSCRRKETMFQSRGSQLFL